MKYPAFFSDIEPIRLYDPLAELLGTFENGLVEFYYIDIVKNTGHSCLTVAGAYLCSLTALKALYRDETPIRGNIEVCFKNSKDEGTTGVTANVISHITGAADESGFKGLNGKLRRENLIKFNEKIDADIKFTRLDTKEGVELIYDPSSIPPDPIQSTLMQRIVQNIATEDEKKLFAKLWQQRVEKIFKSAEKVIIITDSSKKL